MIIPERLFSGPVENKIDKIYNPRSLKQIARDNIRLDERQLNKELPEKMLSPYYFTDRNLKVGFKISLDGHHIHHANSKITIKPNYLDFGIEVHYINIIKKELSVIYARLINPCKFKYQTVFFARFDKQNEDKQVVDETEFVY